MSKKTDVETECMMFTYNPVFKTERDYAGKDGTYRLTVPRAENIDHVNSVCAKYGVDRSRIVYIKPPTPSKKYCRESTDLVIRFFHHYENVNRRRRVLLCDKGNCFNEEGKHIGELLKFEKVISYPSDPHCHLSPNDENLHGIAKAHWRAERKPDWDDVESSLYLMKCMDDVSNETINGFYKRNFYVDNISEADMRVDIMNRITHGSHKKVATSEFYCNSLDLYDLYRTKAPKRGSILPGQFPESLPDQLDGGHWVLYESS